MLGVTRKRLRRVGNALLPVASGSSGGGARGGAVLRKLGLRDRVQAVVLAYDLGLVRPRA